jgi:MFS family permease
MSGPKIYEVGTLATPPDHGTVPFDSDAHNKPWLMYSKRRRLVFLMVLFLAGSSSNTGQYILGVLLPQIKSEFDVGDTELGLLSGVTFAVFYATLGIPLARWADRSNRVRILSFSVIVWSVMTALCGFAQTFWQLVAARIGVGAGEAGALPPAQSLIADYFPPEQRAGAMSLFMSSSAVGYAVGLILGGYIAQHYGWRSAFQIVGVGSLLLGPICLLVLNDPRSKSTSSVTVEPFRSAIGNLFNVPAYRCILYAIVIHFFIGNGSVVFVVSLMTRLFGVSVQAAGATFGTIAILGAIVGNLLGGVVTNYAAKRSLSNIPRIAGWAMVATVPVFEFAFSRSTLGAMEVPLFVGIALLNVIYGPMFSSLHLVCHSNRRATAVAIVLLFANLVGLGLGPLLTGLISDYLAPTYGPAEGLRWAIMILFVAMFAGGAFMLRAANHIGGARSLASSAGASPGKRR